MIFLLISCYAKTNKFVFITKKVAKMPLLPILSNFCFYVIVEVFVLCDKTWVLFKKSNKFHNFIFRQAFVHIFNGSKKVKFALYFHFSPIFMQLNLIFPIVKKILRMSFAGVATQNDSKTACSSFSSRIFSFMLENALSKGVSFVMSIPQISSVFRGGSFPPIESILRYCFE